MTILWKASEGENGYVGVVVGRTGHRSIQMAMPQGSDKMLENKFWSLLHLSPCISIIQVLPLRSFVFTMRYTICSFVFRYIFFSLWCICSWSKHHKSVPKFICLLLQFGWQFIRRRSAPGQLLQPSWMLESFKLRFLSVQWSMNWRSVVHCSAFFSYRAFWDTFPVWHFQCLACNGSILLLWK